MVQSAVIFGESTVPVDDHPVHEKTKITSDFRYGCHNHKPYAKGYYAPDREYRPDGTYYLRLVFIPHTMSARCKYDLNKNDSACKGCRHKTDGC